MPPPLPVWSVSVARDSLSMAPLLLTDKVNGYWVARNGVGPGQASFRKVTATSPFAEGRYMVSKVRDMQMMKVDVRVRAVDSDWMDYQLAVLEQAFTQDYYLLQISIDGVRHHWTCEASDNWVIGNGGQWDDLQASSFVQLVSFNVPRFPTPAYGRI